MSWFQKPPFTYNFPFMASAWSAGKKARSRKSCGVTSVIRRSIPSYDTLRAVVEDVLVAGYRGIQRASDPHTPSPSQAFHPSGHQSLRCAAKTGQSLSPTDNAHWNSRLDRTLLRRLRLTCRGRTSVAIGRQRRKGLVKNGVRPSIKVGPSEHGHTHKPTGRRFKRLYVN